MINVEPINKNLNLILFMLLHIEFFLKKYHNLNHTAHYI